jgi:hypothetical protein
MSAYKIIVPKASNYIDWGSYDGNGTYLFQGSGFTFNPDTANYPNGVLWITEHDGFRVLLTDTDGNIINVINAIDAAHRGGKIASGCPYYSNNGNGTGYGLFWPSSAVSFDSGNNIYITAEEYSTGSHIVRFGLPYTTFLNSSGTTCLPLPNGGINWIAPVSNDTIEGGLGLAVYGNQLLSIHSQNGQQVYSTPHGAKMMVWNDFLTQTFGAPADFTIVRPGNNNWNMEIAQAKISDAIDDLGHLWYGVGDLNVFQLPITSNTQGIIAGRIPLYWVDTGTQLTGTWITGVAFDKINKALYLVDRTQSGSSRARILRVKNYADPTAKLMVDLVIGQTDKTNVRCNQGLSAPNAGTLCDVSQIKFDKLGNLYAVDNDYECHGNRRITVFMADDLKNAVGMFPNLQAKKVFNEPDFTSTANCAYWVTNAPGSPVSIAFDSKNHMVIGNDGYYGQVADQQRELKQLWFYSDPINKQTPDAAINLYMGTPGEMTFDANDNLFIQDATWNKLEMINLCTDPQWLSYLPGVTAVSTCTGSTPTPGIVSPTPTPTATPRPSPSVTPSLSPRPTATPTPIATPRPTVSPTATPRPSVRPTATPGTGGGSPSPVPTLSPSPTPRPTPSAALSISPQPSPSAAGSSVTLQIKFQGVTIDRGSKQVTITLKQNGTTINTQTVAFTANTTGDYSNTTPLTGIGTGMYDIYVKGPVHLTHRFSAQSINATTNDLNLTAFVLLAGDAFNNDRIDIFDYSQVVADFGSRMPTSGSTADFDFNGAVDIFDYSYLVSNFNKTGDL